MNTDQIGLYVHLPFCEFRCDYCDFFTRTHVGLLRQAAILKRTIEQTSNYLENLGNPPVRTVYVGGGTPSSLPLSLLMPFLEQIRAVLGQSSPVEWTLEVNPEDCTTDFFRGIRSTPVTRLSVGVQSFSDSSLKTIGRRGSGATNRRVLNVLNREWGARWSADLIVAVPNHHARDVRMDLETLLDFGARHLSVYELTVERQTVLGHRLRHGTFFPPVEDISAEQTEMVHEFLSDAGLNRYEISNYASKGEESLHNTMYWDYAFCLGVGPGAVGTIPGPSVEYPVTRVSGTHDFNRFVDDENYGTNSESLPIRETATELFMMGLRSDRGVQKPRFRSLIGAEAADVISETIAQNQNLFVEQEKSLALTREGQNIHNSIMRTILIELDGRFS